MFTFLLNSSKLVYYQPTIFTGEISNIDCGFRILWPPFLHGIVFSTRIHSAKNSCIIVLGSHHCYIFDPFVSGNLRLIICALGLESFLARIVCFKKKILLEVFDWIVLRVHGTEAVIDFNQFDVSGLLRSATGP